MSNHDRHQCGGLTTLGVRVYGALMMALGIIAGILIGMGLS